jgi:uncharacterized protein (TIGR03085 family)
MTSFARAERDRLCDRALAAGPDAPTLCGDWVVRDLMAHLVVRETSPLSVGIVVPRLASITDKETERVAKKPFAKLVDKVRKARTPLALPGIDAAVNTAEYFVHHEDIRRASDGWEPRTLEPDEQDALWRVARVSGKGLIRPAGVPVLLCRTDTGTRTSLRAGSDPVVISGLPSEIVLFLYGRRETSGLTFDGPAERVAHLREASLGI